MDSKTVDRHRKLMLEFIDMYKSMPCLWDRKHRGYAVRKARAEAYKQLLQKYRDIDDSATLHTIKHRLDIIRNGFIRELKKVRLSKEMTSDPSMQYIPSLWYYDSCTFLEDQYMPLKDTRTAEPESQSENDEETKCNNEFDDSHSSKIEYLEESSNSSIDHDDTTSRKRRKVEPAIKLEITEDSPNKYSNEEWKCIGRAIALQMKDLTPYQSAIANKLISDAIFYGRLGKLTLDSHIALNFAEDRDALAYS